ncbi:MAG: bifunctional UDP-N-acetylmuramoyl-tripeptide:D-alanyl-D-alanine ligase/alanine racemase, partial [Muribaculaceae bacterium]|nr:bifunctional UDP-N-acetylmuramoyl-tripeptide:D-alanyl-D-alanine ligase/alanine racemase [Muribaculaceae bacterium]
MVLSLAQLCRRMGVDNPNPALAERCLNTFLTDSRSLVDAGGTVFFALSTDTNDGCRYIPWLFAHGVRTFVVNAGSELPVELVSRPDVAVIEVPDTMRALRDAARHTPDIFSGEMIAVTGSRGKTVLKEWLYQLLEPLKMVVRSPRSYNSRIGVPLSLTLIEPETEIAIIEAGVSRRGEMEALRETIVPDTVILTNVGEEHDEGFASREEKIEEKVSLARGAKILIYCADDREVDEYVRTSMPAQRLVRWSMEGLADADYRFKVERDDSGSHFLIYTEGEP